MNEIWYKEYKQYFLDAMRYYRALKKRVDSDNLIIDFMKDYEKTLITEFIFESNFIEKEGLSEGETKKLVFENFDDFKDIREDLSRNMNTTDIEFNVILNEKGLDLYVGAKNKNKDFKLVYNQIIALLYTEGCSLDIGNKRFKELTELFDIKEEIDTNKGNIIVIERLQETYNKLKARLTFEKQIITEKIIRETHKLLSNGMYNNDNGVSGDYRPDGALIDFDTVFLAPSLIPLAMEKLIKDHIVRCNDKSMYNPLLEACKVSADIVRIHPFGDFNGRTSRLMLNYIMKVDKMPILIVLKGNVKDKKKYITAMKHYFQRGSLASYISLVCSTFLKQVETINNDFQLAGINKIIMDTLDENEERELITVLDKYIKMGNYTKV